MKLTRSTLPALTLVLSFAAQGVAAQDVAVSADPSVLAGQIEAIIDSAPVNQAHWGLLVVDLESGDTLYTRNAHRKFVPASNMKVLVTSAALWEMGPDYRFRTEVHAVGERDGEVLRGDIVILPSGDPTWSERWFEDDPDAPLRHLASQVAATGLRTISGDLIVAASRWDSASVQGSWMNFNIPWGFSAVPGPFVQAEGTTTIVVEATIPGVPAQISWSPVGTPDFVIGTVRTVEANDSTAEVITTWLPESRVHRIDGTIQAGETDSIDVSMRLPVREARARFVRLLGEAGVTFLQLPAPASADAPPSSMSGAAGTAPLRPRDPIIWTQADSLPAECDPALIAWCDLSDPIAWVESPPLMAIAKGALEPSQNWITEQLLKALTIHRRGVADWSNAPSVLTEVLAERAGVDTLDLALQDGSGLSAYNLITPRSVVQILSTMDRSEMSADYRDALAAPGEDESTLEFRMDGLESRIQAKTGTISNVNSLSGFVFTDSGRRLVFSILTNGSGLPSSQMRRAIDGVARVLAGS